MAGAAPQSWKGVPLLWLPAVAEPGFERHYAELATGRDTRGVLLADGLPAWATVSHDASRAMLTDPRLANSPIPAQGAAWGGRPLGHADNTLPFKAVVASSTFLSMNGPEHPLLRTTVLPYLRGTQLDRLAAGFDEAAAAVVDQVPRRPGFDVVADVALPLAGSTMALLRAAGRISVTGAALLLPAVRPARRPAAQGEHRGPGHRAPGPRRPRSRPRRPHRRPAPPRGTRLRPAVHWHRHDRDLPGRHSLTPNRHAPTPQLPLTIPRRDGLHP